MTEQNLSIIKKALYDTELAKIHSFELLPQYPFEISNKYKEKINKIILSEKIRENSFLKLSAKKKLIILIASIIALITIFTACVFGEQIKDFIIETYGIMTKFTSDSDEDMMYKEYTFTYIPVGYEINYYIHDDNWCYQEFLSTDGYIQIDQSKSSETSVQLDTENATYRIVRLKDIELHHVIKHNTHSVLWKIEGTTFYLTCKDNLEWEEIEKIILGAITY